MDARDFVTEVAATAVRQARKTQQGIAAESGSVQDIDLNTSSPTVHVLLDATGTVVYAQPLVSVPAIGTRVLVLYLPPSQAVTIPYPPETSA